MEHLSAFAKRQAYVRMHSLQQDNDSKHTSKSAVKWLADYKINTERTILISGPKCN